VWLQQPRQSLSVSIIAGPGSEETLHWTLRSIRDVADEIVIADCGMNDEARRIAAQYPVKLVHGTDPLVHGFERARNIALDECSSDWCLSIDTDERLVDVTALAKYLRENTYHTYALKQHQLACDSDPSFNLAARLFRRREYRGKAVQFWGAVHETAALGLDEGAGPATYLSDVHIAHLGYLNETSRRTHSLRNLPLLDLDQERYPDRLVQKYYLIRENMHLVRYALEQGDGELDDAIRRKCRETIDLYRQHLLRDDRDTDCSALEYYSEALRVLNVGFESVVCLGVGDDAAEARPKKFRFESSADLEAVLRREARHRTSRYDSPWW
jgi:glycosyltransferase involved in cell wall biosynthesis